MRAAFGVNWRAYLAVALVAMFSYAVAFWRTAWVCDDAYITFRVVANFLSGDGLVWNVGERVQVYTHPLWLFALTPFVWLLGEPYLASLILSAFLSLCVYFLFARWVWRTQPSMVLVLLFPLISRSFVDFSSSGLENPLSHLISLGAWICFLNSDLARERKVVALMWLGVAAVLCRPDLILLVAPLFIFVLCGGRGVIWGRLSIMMLVPATVLVAWFVFSVFYYGSFLPNTVLAKVATGIPLSSRLDQAVSYYAWMLENDLPTLLVIAAAVLAGVVSGDGRARFLAGVILGWLGYVAYVGADYMGGRFLSSVFVVSLVLFVYACSRIGQFHPRRALLVMLSTCAVLLSGFLTLPLTLFSPAGFRDGAIRENGMADERGFYYPYNGLVPRVASGWRLVHPWSELGELLHARGGVYVRCAIGMTGYYSGKGVYFLDPFVLADGFLSRLPARDRCRTGHYERAIPPGYLDAVLGVGQLTDPSLSRAFHVYRSVATGPLFSTERIADIWRLHFEVPQLLSRASFDRNAIHAPSGRSAVSNVFSCMGEEFGGPGLWQLVQPREGAPVAAVPVVVGAPR